VRIGDEVLFGNRSGADHSVEGQVYTWLNQHEILGVIPQ